MEKAFLTFLITEIRLGSRAGSGLEQAESVI